MHLEVRFRIKFRQIIIICEKEQLFYFYFFLIQQCHILSDLEGTNYNTTDYKIIVISTINQEIERLFNQKTFINN